MTSRSRRIATPVVGREKEEGKLKSNEQKEKEDYTRYISDCGYIFFTFARLNIKRFKKIVRSSKKQTRLATR